MVYLIEDLLNEYRRNKTIKNPRKIVFKGTKDKDIYNISCPFIFCNKTYILGRIESRDSEYSQIGFFEQKNDGAEYVLDINAPMFKLQDPFFTFIDNNLIVGGVEVSPSPTESEKLIWKTVFYKILDFNKFEKIFDGPVGMKDLRFSQLKDGRIAVVTRPQGEKGGKGKIGFYVSNSLESISIQDIADAPLLDLFSNDEWGGANEIHVLDDNHIGVLGHIAKFSDGYVRHYYSMAFVLNISTLGITDLKIIAERSDFLEGDFKRADLKDVIFSGGLFNNQSEQSILYVGVSDAEAQCVDIPYPFKYNF